jgi:hypothetical protein
MTLYPPNNLAAAIVVACALAVSCAASSCEGSSATGVAATTGAASSGVALSEAGVVESVADASSSGSGHGDFEGPPTESGSGPQAASGRDTAGIDAQADVVVGPLNGADAQASASDANAARLFSGTVNIMVLGSSNESQTCWRAFLWQKLRSNGITNFAFVGSQVVGPDCGVPGYDMACEARPGTIVTSVSAATFHSWFAAHPPDIVLQHIGGADLMDNIAPAEVILTYSVIVEQARAVNPKVIFFVAQHTPQDPTGCTNCLADVMALNALIPAWAAQTTTAESPVSVVDLYTGLDVVADFSDRVHLNTAGSEIVSDRWLAALLPLLEP